MKEPLVDQRSRRSLQIGVIVCVVVGIVAGLLDGGTVLVSVVGGGVTGGLAFLPVAFLFLLYRFGKQGGVQRARPNSATVLAAA